MRRILSRSAHRQHGRLGAFAVLALSAALAACAAGRSGTSISDLPSREFVGHLATIERAYWFHPCGEAAGTRWWVTFTEASVDALERARAAGLVRPGSRAFVRWRAAMTDERVVGPGGPALLVRDILELRAEAAGDC
jgi:hypothetical protein